MLISYPSWAYPPLCGLVPGTSYLMAIKIQNFKRYLCFASMENLFKNHIFVISIKNCTLQLNFKAHLLLIKIRLINAKSQIQPTWRHLLPENFPKSKLSTIISGHCLHISKNLLCSNVPCYLLHLLAPSVFKILQLYFWC